MDTRDNRYSVLLLDLWPGVLPTPAAAEAFTHADLMQFGRKYRGFYNDSAVEPAPSAAAGEAFIPTIRRRRR